MALTRGQQIEHATFGPGVVKIVLDGGRRARVEFEKLPGIPYTLPVSQLRVPGSAAPATDERTSAEHLQPSKNKTSPVEIGRDGGVVRVSKVRDRRRPETSPPKSAEPTKRPVISFKPAARQLFEALRMGVVPSSLLERYTVGRETEVRRVEALVAAGAGMLVVEGHYGTGKTHLLSLAESMALEAGFLTSRVSFDAVEVPASNPLRIYREVIVNLKYPPHGAGGGGLTPLFERLTMSPQHRRAGSPEFHRYLSPALFAHCEGTAESAEAAVPFVEGRGGRADEVRSLLAEAGWSGPKILALPDWRTFGQVLLYLLGGIASWARDAGYTGLALYFDEAESVDQLERTSREFAETILRYFAAVSIPEAALPFRAEDLYRGGQAVHRGLPHRFRPDQPLISCFAFTPLAEVSEAIAAAGLAGRRVLELSEPSSDMIRLLIERLVALHRELHPTTNIEDADLTRLVEHAQRCHKLDVLANVRQVARLVVEYLDLLRHRPDKVAGALEEV